MLTKYCGTAGTLGEISVGQRLESDLTVRSTGHDNDPDVLETEKAKNLAGKPHQTSAPMDHAPGWNELLASSSEASVKVCLCCIHIFYKLIKNTSMQADRDSTSPAELASRTVEHVQARYSDHQGSSENDSVKGPLSGAGKDPILVKKTIKEETTEAFKAPTDSEDVVRSVLYVSLVGADTISLG